jgi:hypothetical protein
MAGEYRAEPRSKRFRLVKRKAGQRVRVRLLRSGGTKLPRPTLHGQRQNHVTLHCVWHDEVRPARIVACRNCQASMGLLLSKSRQQMPQFPASMMHTGLYRPHGALRHGGHLLNRMSILVGEQETQALVVGQAS